MHGVVEILQIFLVKSKRHVAHRAIYVAHVVEEHALNVGSDKRKPQLHIIEEQRISTQRKPGWRRSGSARNEGHTCVARAGFVVGKRSQRIGAAPEETLRQRNGLLVADARRRGKGADYTELRLPGKYDVSCQLIVRRVAQQDPCEAAIRAEELAGHANVP